MERKINIRPTYKLAHDFLDLKTLNTNVIVEYLEESMKLREMPIEQQIKTKLLKFR